MDRKSGDYRALRPAPSHAVALPGAQDAEAFLFPRHARGRGIWIPANCWRTVCVDANLGRLRLHDLRHTAVSQAVMTGENLPFVGKLRGLRDGDIGNSHSSSSGRTAWATTRAAFSIPGARRLILASRLARGYDLMSELFSFRLP